MIQVLKIFILLLFSAQGIAGDGVRMVMVKHRYNVACGLVGKYTKTLKVRLYVPPVVSTMVYGSISWFLSD